MWIGLVPALMALLIGAGLRRWLPANMFVYTLGGAFMGTVVVVFLSGVLMELLHRLAGAPAIEQALMGCWLMAWGDVFLTGMFAAIFVAFAPQWLATWSDERYLSRP
ncbi:MAG: putative membrane protein [Hydrogenophaga sp.]